MKEEIITEVYTFDRNSDVLIDTIIMIDEEDNTKDHYCIKS